MAKIKASQVIRIVFICIFAIVFIVSAILLVDTLIEYRAEEKMYGELHKGFVEAVGTGEADTAADIWTRPSAETTAGPKPSEPAETTKDPAETKITEPAETTTGPAPVYSERFLNACKYIEELKKKNPDVTGYIQIDFGEKLKDKKISYPLMKGEDNNVYIRHAYDGTQLSAGAIFLDYRCADDLFMNRVSVIYGHNMNNGAMFHNLKYLRDKEYFDACVINIYTLSGIYRYKPFSVYNATSGKSNYGYMFFNSDVEYGDFLNEIQSRNYIYEENPEKLTAEDRIVTLSTCLNSSPDARMAVHAVLTGVSK